MIKKLYSFAVLTFLFLNSASAQEKVTLENPVYPGTKIYFAYAAFNCPVKGSCPSGKEFEPKRAPFIGADYFVNENGVCKVLGFKGAVANSSETSSGMGNFNFMQMDSQGNPAGADGPVMLNKITCIKGDTRFVPKKVTLIQYPRVPNTGSKISRGPNGTQFNIGNEIEDASDENAVCNLLGFNSAVPLSSYSGNGYEARETGVVTQVLKSGKLKQTQAYVMRQIMCM